jgi:hypothetical protein
MYAVLYLAATRTQIYLTARQRTLLDERMAHEHKSMAQIIREAIDTYLVSDDVDVEGTLGPEFGALPDLVLMTRNVRHFALVPGLTISAE